jgi:hypothetical protein
MYWDSTCGIRSEASKKNSGGVCTKRRKKSCDEIDGLLEHVRQSRIRSYGIPHNLGVLADGWSGYDIGGGCGSNLGRFVATCSS